MNLRPEVKGHLFALFTILIWSTTLISIKILLGSLSPSHIVIYRFIIGYAVLLLLEPKFRKPTSIKEEIYFLCAGLTGVCAYMFTQNIALTYSTASNVGLILSVSPMLTAILFHFIYKEKIGVLFIMGFIVAFTGIFIVMYNGSVNLSLNPLGDFLALTSAASWAAYGIFLKKTFAYNYSVIYSTRKIFFYALLVMLPVSYILGVRLDLSPFKSISNVINVLYLGVGASSLCFITWSKASEIIGGVKTNSYIYLSPLITMIFSAIVLGEKITLLGTIGCVFILLGLYISEKKKNNNTETNNITLPEEA